MAVGALGGSTQGANLFEARPLDAKLFVAGQSNAEPFTTTWAEDAVPVAAR